MSSDSVEYVEVVSDIQNFREKPYKNSDGDLISVSLEVKVPDMD